MLATQAELIGLTCVMQIPRNAPPLTHKHPSEYYRPNNYVDTVNNDGMYAEGTIALILRLCLCAGVAPLRASRARTGWHFQASAPFAALQAVVMTVVSWYHLIVSHVDVIVISSVVLELQQPIEKRSHARKSVQACVWLAVLMLRLGTASLVVYRGPAQMRSLHRVLDLLHQVKFDLNINSSAKRERIKSVAFTVMLLWMISVMVTSFVSHLIQIPKETPMWTIMLIHGAHYIADIQAVLAVVKWTCTVLAIHEGATALNQHLKELGHGSNFSSSLQAKIRRLALSYERMSDMMREMNDANGLFLMIVLMTTFLGLVVTQYSMMMNKAVFGITLSLDWTLYDLAVLALTIEPCQWTHTQRENTATLLGQLIVHQAPKNEHLSKELDQFAKQLMLSNTTFSTLGVYTLDRKLIAAILGGVTTYLLIVIQFQMISNH